jgi:tetratricopeptide (TPR) repeat protein
MLILFGLVWFGLALGPTSQIMLHHIPRADRFLYLPLVGLAVAVAAGVVALGKVLQRRAATVGAIAVAVLSLGVLGTLSAAQVGVWRNSVTLWDNCVKVAPKNPMAHGCLADNLARAGRFDAAVPHYEIALRLDPNDLDTLNNFAIRLATCEDEALRDYSRSIQLAERGCRLSQWEDPQLRRTLAKAYANSAKALNAAGRFAEAVDCCRAAIEADPEYEPPLFNLAWLLATCPDENVREPDEAVALVERARALAGQLDPIRLRIVAEVYARSGRFEKAAAAAREAVDLAQSVGDGQLAEELRTELKRYQDLVPSDEIP